VMDLIHRAARNLERCRRTAIIMPPAACHRHRAGYIQALESVHGSNRERLDAPNDLPDIIEKATAQQGS